MELSDYPRRIPGVSVVIFVILSLSIIAAGWMFYVREKAFSEKTAGETLSAIADLKISQIVNWRKERLGDASVIALNPLNDIRIAPFLENPSPGDSGDDIRAWMESFQKIYSYHDIVLTDIHGRIRLSVGYDRADMDGHAQKEIAEAIQTKKPILSDFHRSEDGIFIHLGLFVPLISHQDSRVVGVLRLRIDPNRFLYPLIQTWPTPSLSAETLLVRRNSHEVLFLNELRHRKNSALSLRLPITDKDLPASRAVLGVEGIIEGRDYRGVPVLADIRRIPDSNWAMVAKVDKDEIFAPMFARIRMIWAAGSILILLIGVFFLFHWKKREAEFYRQEVAERKKAEEALRESQRQAAFLADLLEHSSQPFSVSYPDGRLGIFNAAFPKMLGYTKEEFMPLNWIKDLTPPEWIPIGAEKLDELHRTGQPMRFEKEYFRKNGSRVPAELLVHLVRDEAGQPMNYYSFITDITERKKAEEALQIRLKLREYADAHTMDDLLQYLLDQTERLTASHIGFFHFFNEDRKELTLQAWSGNTIKNMCTAEGKGAHYPVEKAGVWADCVHQRRPVIHNDYATLPNRKGIPEGHAPIIRELTLPIIRNDRIVAIIGMGNKSEDYTETDVQVVFELTNIAWDVIARKQAEERVIYFSRIFEDSLDEIYIFDANTLKFVEANRSALSNLGYSMNELREMTPLHIKPGFTIEMFSEIVEPLRSGMEKKVVFQTEHQRKNKTNYPVEVHLQLNDSASRKLFTAIILDITERKMLDDIQLFLLEYNYVSSDGDFFIALAQYLAEKLSVDFVCIDRLENENLSAKTLAVWVNGKFEDNLSYTLKDTPCGDVVGKTVCSFSEGVRHKFPKDEVLQEMKAESYVGTTLRDSAGHPIGLIALIWKKPFANIKLAETILKLVSVRTAGELERRQAAEERKKLEIQLRQAQKMEAVGQLAGGVAHDFNNLLYVITGYSDMVMDQLPKDGILHKNMSEIMKAAQRAATLVRQLLLFSRREAMQSRYLNLNELIGELMKMIRRIIGEHIMLEVLPGFDIETVYADPGQIEQVLMNLCVNARDAMPEGGKIVIETETVLFDAEYCKSNTWAKEGEYVLLTVSDTGSGIPHEIQDRIFEPFFTTKEVGKGTGLGLAVVYGIVRSHQGMVQMYSEPGQGTAFKIYLPVAETSRSSSDNEKEPARQLVGGSETILVAEDEEPVRTMIVHILQKVGYRVISAKDGEKAIALFEKHSSEIDLALLDVIMPKLGGQKVFEHIRAIRPDMPIIFSTGYSRGILNSDSFPANMYEMIQKPCNPNDLLRKIRKVLDSH